MSSVVRRRVYVKTPEELCWRRSLGQFFLRSYAVIKAAPAFVRPQGPSVLGPLFCDRHPVQITMCFIPFCECDVIRRLSTAVFYLLRVYEIRYGVITVILSNVFVFIITYLNRSLSCYGMFWTMTVLIIHSSYYPFGYIWLFWSLWFVLGAVNQQFKILS